MFVNKIEEAVAAMEDMMINNRRNTMEQMGRSGKGELFILKYLYDRDTAVIPSEISDAMHTSTARISAALGSLEKKGQVRREIDKTNRRNILVTITDEGRERSHEDIEKMRSLMIRVMTELGERDATELVRLMRRLFEISSKVFDSSSADI